MPYARWIRRRNGLRREGMRIPTATGMKRNSRMRRPLIIFRRISWLQTTGSNGKIPRLISSHRRILRCRLGWNENCAKCTTRSRKTRRRSEERRVGKEGRYEEVEYAEKQD